jgi:ferritin-like metal-binding protein YciE
MIQELLVAWLNDARAMEKAQLKRLGRMQADFEAFTEIRSELRQHMTEVEEAVEDLEEAIKGIGGKVVDAPQSGDSGKTPESISPYHDELVKDMLALHASEHYGHITYMALAECASHLGEDEIADMCERAAEEKRIMSEWTEEQLPTVITHCLKVTTEEE